MSPEEVIAYVKDAGRPVSARNMARKFGIKRAYITQVLSFVAKHHDRKLCKTLRHPLNKKHQKPVWTYA
jgi:uncharacterized membrane protein YqiK